MVKIIKPIGCLTGSIGGITIYRRGDTLVMRPRHNGECRRTLTPGQMRQRARYSNATNLWKSFLPGPRPQFQRPAGRGTDYGSFKSHALQCQPAYLTRQQVASGGCVVVDVAVSHGSLVPVGVGLQGGLPVTDIALGTLVPSADTTVAQLARAVTRLNPAFAPGDVLRFVLLRQLWNPVVPTPYASGSIADLPLDPACDDPLALHVGASVGFGSVGGFLGAAAAVEGGMAWVHVRPTDTGRLFSSQRLCVTNPLVERYASDDAFATAAQSYGGLTQRPFLS